jgi:hypothetical protein
MVGRPKLAKTLPKAPPAESVAVLLGALGADPEPPRRSDWTGAVPLRDDYPMGQN